LDNLVKLRGIESETFDFKGPEFKNLHEHLCAFANYSSGGYIVLGIEQEKGQSRHLIGFKKVGFDNNKEDWIRNEVNNQMTSVEPTPIVNINFLHDNNQIYPILKIVGEEAERPYFVKTSGKCFIRVGASTSPASRTTVLNLFSNLITKRTDIERLRVCAIFLKEELTYTSKRIRDIIPVETDEKILPVDLSYIKNAALSTEWFLLQNDLLGGHIGVDSLKRGFHSFFHEIEQLNLSINTYNTQYDFESKQKMKHSMRYWEPDHDRYKEAIGFLDKVCIKCTDFLMKIS
jgi:hypothetical protein